MSDEVFAAEVAERVFQLHQLNENVVFGVEPGRLHARALRQIEEKRQVENDRRREDRVAAKEIDLNLHLVAEPAKDVDIVPTFLVITTRWVVVNADHMRKVFVERGINFRLQNVLEY